MHLLCVSLILGIVFYSSCTRGIPLDQEDPAAEPIQDPEDREKRSLFPWVVGETILDIQCRRGYLTVCSPDGPCGCPTGYTAQTNVGVCGFATLNHYLNTSNIAGTCCYKLPASLTTTTAASVVAQNIILPQIVAYPVYAQYPYAFQQQVVQTGQVVQQTGQVVQQNNFGK